MRRFVLVACTLAACATEDKPPAPAPVSAAPPSAAGLVIEPPARWTRDIRASEGVVTIIERQVTRPLCAALRGEDAAALRGLLTSGFRGQVWDAPRPAPSDPGLTRQTRPVAPARLRERAFADQLLAARAAFKRLDRCSLGVVQIQVAAPGKDAAFARLSMEIAGRDADDVPLLWRADWTVGLARYGDTWRLDKARPEPLDVLRTRAAPFTDVSREVGFGLHRSVEAAKALKFRADGMDIETLGGLAVIDWERDHRPDLLVWNKRRMLQLFRNDGRGGFERRGELIPAEQVGMHLLYADLDGDGVEELISTALTGCANGTGRLAVFKRTADGFAPATPLAFPMDCVDPDGASFQHIAAADVTGDGRLDLIVSGYSDHYTRQANFNHFDSHKGLRNLLFINQGGLRFSEEGQARGLTATRFTYVAAAFDHDGDGDNDLYFANDFGANALLANDGQGRFTPVKGGPLTENGQSMGLTVADFDGDLRLDVYVSNMYSKAGNRIVPLADDRLAPATLQTLKGLAAGNALYRKTDDGYVSAAKALGINKAGWAWGQAVFDADNDGDRDLYVVNGMSSHSAKAAPDF